MEPASCLTCKHADVCHVYLGVVEKLNQIPGYPNQAIQEFRLTFDGIAKWCDLYEYKP